MFKATCHCGAVELLASYLPESVTSCNCSICHRLGAHWAYYDEKDVEMLFDVKALSTYQWGRKTLELHRCTHCGCATHYTAVEEDGSLLVAINSRMVETSVTEGIPVRRFDGAVSWKYLDD